MDRTFAVGVDLTQVTGRARWVLCELSGGNRSTAHTRIQAARLKSERFCQLHLSEAENKNTTLSISKRHRKGKPRSDRIAAPAPTAVTVAAGAAGLCFFQRSGPKPASHTVLPALGSPCVHPSRWRLPALSYSCPAVSWAAGTAQVRAGASAREGRRRSRRRRSRVLRFPLAPDSDFLPACPQPLSTWFSAGLFTADQ